MKKIIILLLVLKSLTIASNDLNTTSLDMFLFKIGFKALGSDVHTNNAQINKNTNSIHNLEKKMQMFLDTNSKNTISSGIKIHTNDNKNENTIKRLNERILILQERVDNLINKNNEKIKPIKQIAKKYTKKRPMKLHKIEKKVVTKSINKTKIITNTKYKYAKVAFDNVKVHYLPQSNSKVTKLLLKSTLVKIQYCNKYHWCKVYKKHEYIAQIRLKF